MSKYQIGKHWKVKDTSKMKGHIHKENCQCSRCKIKRNEWTHKENCKCSFCKLKKGEYIGGKNHPNYGKHWKIKDISKYKGNENARRENWSEEVLERRKERLGPTTGKSWKISEEKRIKMKGRQNAKGSHRSEEFKKNAQKTQIERYKNPEERKRLSEWQIEHPNKKFSNTLIERKITEELTKRNIYYQQNIGLCKIANVDFYLPEYNTVIECDGCYYHNCLIHYPEYHKEVRIRDCQKTKLFLSRGFNIYRFWGHEINESVEKCINKIFA